MKTLALSVVALTALLGCRSASAQPPEETVQFRADANKIYWGDPEGTKPATIRKDDCFDVIPEWKEIVRRKLTEQDADYFILLAKANDRFRSAVEKVAKAEGYDLVAEEGAIEVPEGEALPPDMTQKVVDELDDDEEDIR